LQTVQRALSEAEEGNDHGAVGRRPGDVDRVRHPRDVGFCDRKTLHVMARASLLRHRLILAILATASSLACFEPPVTERLEVRFLPGESVMVRVSVRIASPDEFKSSPLAQKRIEAARRDALEGNDPWTRRLESLEPEAQRTLLDRTQGEISRVEQRVILSDAAKLQRFFSDSLVRATVTRKPAETEFSLIPEPGTRATRQQQEEMRRGMNGWAVALSRYLEAGRKLYAYLEDRPERARACFGSIFRDFLPDEERERLADLSYEDESFVEPFKKELEEVLSLFEVPEDSPYSEEELSRLVFDPFPAAFTVRVPGPVLEVEGFAKAGPGGLTVPGLSLWEAFRSVQDRWISPSPVAEYFEQARMSKPSFDLEGFVARRRAFSPAPSSREVLEALEKPLKAAPVYRVRWSTRDLPEAPEFVDSWDSPALN
jgi:hypothetical protein